jgi:hypothetical protein
MVDIIDGDRPAPIIVPVESVALPLHVPVTDTTPEGPATLLVAPHPAVASASVRARSVVVRIEKRAAMRVPAGSPRTTVSAV